MPSRPAGRPPPLRSRTTSVPTTSTPPARARRPHPRPGRARPRGPCARRRRGRASRARRRPGRRPRGRRRSAGRPPRPAARRRATSSASAAVVDGSTCSAVSASSRQMAPATPGKIDAGVRELDVEPEQTRHHQQVGDVRIGEHVRARAARGASRSRRTRAWPCGVAARRRGPATCVEPATSTLRPFACAQQLVEVARDEVDDLELRRLLGR